MCFRLLTYTDVYLALDGGFVEWRVVPVVPSVGVGSLTQQQGHHLKTTNRTSAFTFYLEKKKIKSQVVVFALLRLVRLDQASLALTT